MQSIVSLVFVTALILVPTAIATYRGWEFYKSLKSQESR